MNLLHNSYSETASAHKSFYSVSAFSPETPPLSSTPTSTPTHPIQVSCTRPKRSLSFNAQEFVPTTPIPFTHHVNNMSGNDCRYLGFTNQRGENMSLPMTPPYNPLNNECQNQLLLRQQQILHEKQQLLQKQQKEFAITVAKQQLALSVAVSSNPSQDEIANSLKMYALLSTNKSTEAPPSPVDEVMQEFASNGYTSDELNKYQQYQANAAMSNQHLPYAYNYPYAQEQNYNNYDLNMNTINNNLNNINQLYNHQQIYENLNPYSEMWRQQVLNFLPTQFARQTEAANAAIAAAAVAAAINMDYNKNQNNKPIYKKSNFKKDFGQQGKRCVFCENNQEPEAVVKSHAVRDAYGRVLCPKLRVYTCPICKESGDNAHTVKYCPKKPIITMDDALKAESTRSIKPTYNQRQMEV